MLLSEKYETVTFPLHHKYNADIFLQNNSQNKNIK
jgi:hypothetical protein